MSDTVLVALIAAGIPALVSVFSAIYQARSKRLADAMKQNCAHMDVRFDEIDKRISDIKKDVTRTQLLQLLSHNSDDVESILTVAKFYFEDLEGDWYVSSVFVKWAKKHNVNIASIKIIHQERK